MTPSRVTSCSASAASPGSNGGLYPTLADDAIARVVALALAEDVGDGDLTTDAIVPSGELAQARLLLEEPGVVAGLPVAEAVFRSLDPAVELRPARGRG